MKYSNLVERIAGEGADAWEIHYAARAAQERGEDVIILSVGDPEIDTPQPVLERAIEALRAGDTHYTPVAGRDLLRQAIARAHQERTGQPVQAANVIFLAGAQNALFAASLCLAGPGDEVIAFEPLYPTYPATLEVSGARMVRVPAPAAVGLSHRSRCARVGDHAAHSRDVFRHAEQSERRHNERSRARRHRRAGAPPRAVGGGRRGIRRARARRPRSEPCGELCLSRSSPSAACPKRMRCPGGAPAGWSARNGSSPMRRRWRCACCTACRDSFKKRRSRRCASPPPAESRIREFCARRRDFLLAALAGIPGIRCHAPQAGMFMLMDVRDSGLSGYDFMCELYRSEGVSVLDGGAFGHGTSGFVRVCFATDEAALREAGTRIRRFVERRR